MTSTTTLYGLAVLQLLRVRCGRGEARFDGASAEVRPTAFDVVMANQARQGREEQFLVPGDFNQGRTGTVAVVIAAVGVVLAATAGGQSYQNYVERVMGTLNYGYGLSLCFRSCTQRRLRRSSLATTSTVTASRSTRVACIVLCQLTASSLMTRSSRQCFHSVTGARQTACCVQAQSKLQLAAEVPKEK